jgi:hypothetical protein
VKLKTVKKSIEIETGFIDHTVKYNEDYSLEYDIFLSENEVILVLLILNAKKPDIS